MGGGIFSTSPTTMRSSSDLPLKAINSARLMSYSSAIARRIAAFDRVSSGGTGVGVPVAVAVARGVAVGNTGRVGVRVMVGVSAAIVEVEREV